MELQKRGDYSSIITGLLQDIPNFDQLPDAAKAALLEGENRLVDAKGGDYSLTVLAFSKAVEVSLKEMVLESFRKAFSLEFEIDKVTSVKVSNKLKGAHKFLQFVEKGYFIGLGEMVLASETVQ